MTLSPILSYTPGLSVFLFLPRCILLLLLFPCSLTPFLSVSTITNLSHLSQFLSANYDWNYIQQGRSAYQNNALVWSRCWQHSHPQTMMDYKIARVCSESFAVLYFRVHSSALSAELYNMLPKCTLLSSILLFIFRFLKFKIGICSIWGLHRL